MNILMYWKWLTGISAIFIILFAVNALYFYDKGKNKVYQDIAATPVKTKIEWKHDTLPAPPPVIKWLKPEKVYETPPEVKAQIDSLGSDIDRLKAMLVEKSRPFETKIDSARYYLYILTNPWSRQNKIDLRLKSVPFQYPEITNSQLLVRDPPWWHDVLKIGGGALAGYGVARLVHK